MSYLVLARKWRPQGFEAIIGQEHVTRTLKNAIEQNRIHHAFLFCGARGVGKTTAARVLARALNCSATPGPTTEPCGTCSACVEIAAGTAIDVFEIDGASNRGINEIRELRDGVAYAPQRDRYKIYIIDEVHMLTTEAFNALLKTLEEPPAHVKFIFATTEPHKIPVTILSRCQRFDFKRIPLATMVEYLARMLADEGVTIDDGGLRVVARESEGSMRDALSLLDRIISSCGNDATYAQVAQVLGVADRAWLTRLARAALGHDAAAGLAVIEEVFEFGVDLKQFATDFVHYLRDVIVLRVAGEKAGLTDLSAEETTALVALGREHDVMDLERLVQIVIRAAERLAHANFPRLELEMAVVRMCRVQPLQPIDAMVARLEAIERAASSGAPLPELNRAPRAPAPARPAAGGTFDGGGAPTGGAQAAPVLGGMARSAGPPDGASTGAPTPEARAATVTPINRARPVVAEAPAAHVVAAPSRGGAMALAAPAELPATEALAEPAPAPPEAPPSASPAIAEAPPLRVSDDAWEAFVNGLREAHPALAGSLDQGQVTSCADGVLTIAFAGRASAARARACEAEVLALAKTRFPWVCGLRVTEDAQAAATSPMARRRERDVRAREQRRRELEGHALVRDVLDRFGGELVRIELEDDEEGR